MLTINSLDKEMNMNENKRDRIQQTRREMLPMMNSHLIDLVAKGIVTDCAEDAFRSFVLHFFVLTDTQIDYLLSVIAQERKWAERTLAACLECLTDAQAQFLVDASITTLDNNKKSWYPI